MHALAKMSALVVNVVAIVALITPLSAQPTIPNATPSPWPVMQFFDNLGAPVAGGKLCTYAANTTTPQATYTTAAANVSNANPVILDSAGRVTVFLGPRLYHVKLLQGGDGTCSTGTTIWDADNFGDTAAFFINYVKTAGTATMISYTNPASGAVQRTVAAKLNDMLSVKDFGAVGDGTTDDYAAFTAAIAVSSLEQCIYVPDGTYALATALFSDHPICFTGDQWRLKYTGLSTAYVWKLQGGAALPHDTFMEGSFIQGAIFDGQGNTIDGLLLQAVVSAQMNYLRATNVTGHGFACNWCQQVTFEHIQVSQDFEPFTTTPAGGVLIGSISVANQFIQINIDHVSGNGIDILYGFNNIFTGGTSEGNGALGVYCNGLASPFAQCINNTFTNLDTEANGTGDYVFEGLGAFFNTITSANSFSSPGVWFKGAAQMNTIVGGFIGQGSKGDAASFGNSLINVSCTSTGTCWTDSGQNTNTVIYNKFDATFQDATDNFHKGQVYRHAAAATYEARIDTTGDTTALMRIGNPAGSFAGIYCDSGFAQCWLNYLLTGGLTFMSETSPETAAVADGAIVNHKWCFGSFCQAPVYKFHFLDGSITTGVAQAAPGQGTADLWQYRDKVTNSSTLFSAITHDGQFAGPVQSAGTAFSVVGCGANTLVGGSMGGSFKVTTTGACSAVVTLGGVTAAHSFACWANNSDTANLLRAIPTSTTTMTIAGTTVSGDTLSFGCITY